MVAYLADECVAGSLVRALSDAGHDVARSAESIPGAGDADVLALVVREQRVLLTEDTDFGELVVRLGHSAVGIVRIDLQAMPVAERPARLVNALQDLGGAVNGALVTVEPTRTRLRPLLGAV